eukprot:TRINITY_DN2798_c0_g2_i2.p1 TRINITY_DN2798_c0_g2~~TRINITY_DN2798_c0_g2_i2.p1  ORF type:complete len:71 (+),score=6.15 TRINITY_DN2798_c0_g2_i2:31-243(+)
MDTIKHDNKVANLKKGFSFLKIRDYKKSKTHTKITNKGDDIVKIYENLEEPPEKVKNWIQKRLEEMEFGN